MAWSPRVDVGVFEQAEIKEGIDITAPLLADLHNLALCFGAKSEAENVKRLVFRIKDNTITITVSTEEGNYGMVMIVGHMMSPDPHIITGIIGGDGLPCNIFIDTRLNSEILQHIITTADRQADQKGGIKDGQRTDLCISDKPPAMVVETIFSEPGACIPIIPQEGDTKESLMERAKQTVLAFDKPNELSIMDHPISGLSVIRRSHVEYIKRRQEIAHDVLKEHGYDPREVGEITPEVLKALREEIDRRIKTFREEFLAERERILPISDKLQQD